MSSVIHLVFALIALGFLVFIHELGHYIVARRVGMRVEVFSIGFGKPIFSWMRKGVRWQMGWLIFGGYVKIAGMEADKATGKMPADGFFGKKPLDRIKVALAGPVANLLAAFLIFVVIWSFGGRSENFGTVSTRVGYVDPKSELAAYHVAPGDKIVSLNRKPYKGFKDLLYTGLLADGPVLIEGLHLTPDAGGEPFSVQATPYARVAGSIKTLGILAPARLLIYEGPLPENSPMKESGIMPGDRLIWAEGEPIYSVDQLSHLINEQKAVIKIERAGKILFVRVPRLSLSSLKLTASESADLADLQFAAHLKGRTVLMVPYVISNRLVVERSVIEVGETTRDSALMPGDRILGVDGKPVPSLPAFLQALQTHKTEIIVQRGVVWPDELPWKEANQFVDTLMPWHELEETLAGGQTSLVVLSPVTAKKIEEFAVTEADKQALEQQIMLKKQEFSSITDPEKRNAMLQLLEEEQHKLMLGISFTDLSVRYNPPPYALFSTVFDETTETLKSLVLGSVNPKMLSGPVGIIQVMQSSWSVGILEALFWVAAISINLGVLNLLPLPVLDGGYILLSLFELITGKKVNPKILEKVILPFAILLIAFFLFVTYYDIKRLF
jgi:regulator of sigma E protease